MGFLKASRNLPKPLAYALLGAMWCGLLGGVVGLLVGLSVYPPTAWFAVLEIGIPAALLGFVAGLLVGAAMLVVDRGHGAKPSH
ncbi:hypothetical protein [Paeniglutamicibacter psychrophenolicus]|uniref:hypothetical protein n=1 Tax=Paeniglutamicibacter psychrophenolicus TaxID=257454 RepID=UPI0027858FB3|nr:hypothetical protein [Paeniglutamicibacter psychrophenolicus]MDQ0094517.1 hypothetical protein [Paeniglutamicibacter psychrophenolicus]